MAEADYDDAEWDGTDYAHPAWWRGNDAGVLGAARRIKDVLDGKDDGAGTLGSTELEEVRRRVLALMGFPKPAFELECVYWVFAGRAACGVHLTSARHYVDGQLMEVSSEH